jgi:hypothetical protein
MEEIMDGVKTRTLGVFVVALSLLLLYGEGLGVRREVRSGRKAWTVRIGCNRCVLKRSAKLDGGIVAIGEVW